MKSLLLLLISFTVFSQKAFIKENHSSLDIDSKINGRCKHTRNQLNKAQLNNVYGTNLKHPLKDTSEEYIKNNFNCIFITRNLKRDSNKLTIAPAKVFEGLKNEKDKSIKVSGKIRYLGVAPKKYNYTLSTKNNESSISVKVFFEVSKKNIEEQRERYELEKKSLLERINTKLKSNDEFDKIYRDEKFRSSLLDNLKKQSLLSSKEILNDLSFRLKAAESIWESGAGTGYDFNFEIAENKSDADFILKLATEGSRGPYDTEWSLKWGVRTIAHELGHMMGLDDEYDNALTSTISGLNGLLVNKDNKLAIKKMVCSENHDKEDIKLFNYFRTLSFGSDRASKCDQSSIMCDHIKGSPKKWHIYTILKRFYL